MMGIDDMAIRSIAAAGFSPEAIELAGMLLEIARAHGASLEFPRWPEDLVGDLGVSEARVVLAKGTYAVRAPKALELLLRLSMAAPGVELVGLGMVEDEVNARPDEV